VSHINIVESGEVMPGPPTLMAGFLRSRGEDLTTIYHPFAYSTDYRSRMELPDGEKRKLLSIRCPGIVVFLRDLFATLYFVLSIRRRFHVYIGFDCLNALVGLFLREIGLVQRTIFYMVDYTPKRFSSRFLSTCYRLLGQISARYSDSVWVVSNRQANIVQHNVARKPYIVPYWPKREEVGSNLAVRRNTLVFVGHLVLSKGLRLLLEAFEEILAANSQAELFVVGEGSHSAALRAMVAKKGLDSRVKFTGVLSRSEVLKLLPTCEIGLAPYDPDPSNFTWYADAWKVKDYLASGLAVIITRVPEIAERIEACQAGEVVEYQKEEIARAAIKLLSDRELLENLKRNAIKLASHYDWETILERAFLEFRSDAGVLACRK